MAATTIPVEFGETRYDVVVGPGVRGETAALTAGFDAFAVLADQAVTQLHGLPCVGAPTLEIPGGEVAKTFQGLERSLEFCATSGLSRRSALVAFGGGTIGDLGGLTASLFKRGMAVIQIPTTLLAQVDASVGGKTAINLSAGKNLAGTFHQPAAVLCDTELLATLPNDEFQSGLGEVVKTAIIEGEADLEALELDAAAVLRRDPAALKRTVSRCVQTKARVVALDPTEKGVRRTLNLGHTFAHAIEHAAGYGRVPHGIAVGVGLVLAARAAEAHYGSTKGLRERTADLLRAFGLPTTLAELRQDTELAELMTVDALVEGLGHDKKGSVGRPEFVLPRAAGELECGIPLGSGLLRDLFGTVSSDA